MSNSFFQNASQFSTGDLNFSIGNCNITNYFSHNREALELLLKHTTKEATHESVTYSYAPTCHPSTRRIIRNDIIDFIHEDQGTSLRLAWLSGPAGAGKSCIQRSIVEECLAENILGGSFFFGRDFGCDSADGFVATIAHQLCRVIPRFRDAILFEISFDPSILDKSLPQQMQRLVLDPLKTISGSLKFTNFKDRIASPTVIIVDGLDECRDSAQRLQVIRILRDLARHPTFPFCVVISSRPETDILTAFAEEPTTRKFLLHNYDSDEDIMAYLVEEFARIRRTHPARRILDKSWPMQEVLVLLMKMASGQFIFVSTVIRYVEHRQGLPENRLNLVLKAVSAREMPSSGFANPLGELDALYTGIFHEALGSVAKSHLRLVLHAIPEIWRIVETNSLLVESGGMRFHLGPSSRMLDSFFEFVAGTTDLLLSQLGALVHCPTNVHMYIRFYHKSMEDYLKTPERSGDLFQSEADTAAQFIVAALKNLKRWSLRLEPPEMDIHAALGALYLCVRFTWGQIPGKGDKKIDIVSELPALEGAEVLCFDLTILLGWILLYGRRLWPNPHDMLHHMKPQNAPLEGLRDRWLNPVAKGLKIIHTCERSLWLQWKAKCPPLCKIIRRCCRNSHSLFSFLEENWHSDRREKIMTLQNFENILPASHRGKRANWWTCGQSYAQASHATLSDSVSGSSGPTSAVFNYPSKSTQSLSAVSWSSRSSASSISRQHP